MSASDADRNTTLLHRYRDGDAAAGDQLLGVVYRELHGLAKHYLRRERVNHTLQPTALINEAYLRIVDQTSAVAHDKAHFCAMAARTMRQVLVDHARRKGAEKRGGDRASVTLDEAMAHYEAQGLDVIDLNDALDELARLEERKARVVELRFFGGLTATETAEVLGIAEKTVEADWYMARAWLRRALTRGDHADSE